MVECGSIKNKPGRDPISGFMILLYVCLTLIFICTVGSCWDYITNIGGQNIGSIFSFIADAISLTSIVFIMIGYFKPSNQFLKNGFIMLLVTGIIDICLFVYGVLKSLSLAFGFGLIKVVSEGYCIFAVYTHAYVS